MPTKQPKEDLSRNWQAWVCEPVIKYPISQGDARILLEAAGIMASFGIPVLTMIKRLMGIVQQERINKRNAQMHNRNDTVRK